MTGPAASVYRRLMRGGGRRDAFDRHIFACLLAAGLTNETVPPSDYLGLPPAILRLIAASYFPFSGVVIPAGGRSAGEDAIEEEDFRTLLLSYRASDAPEEEWLSAMIARRAQDSNHLWEDLGLTCRDDLNELMRRHFPKLFAMNDKNMRWKKFFYRLMCESEGMRLCKSPHCETCPDVAQCFEADSVLFRLAG